MAIVAKKETEERYSHLKKVYNEVPKEKIEKKAAVKEVEFKKEEIKVEKNDVLKFVGLVVLLTLLGLSGFLIQKFM